MMQDAPRILLIGAGHAHLVALPDIRRRLPDAQITLIDPSPFAAYSGMLPGVVAGHYEPDQARFDLSLIARQHGVRLVTGRVDGLDPKSRQATTTAGRMGFDIASIDIGIQGDLRQIPGFAEHGVAVKPLSRFAERWTQFLQNPGPVTIIGGGVAGVELALAAAHCIGPHVTLIEKGPRVVPELPSAPRRLLLELLAERGVTVHIKSTVACILPEDVILADRTRIASDLTIAAAGGQPAPWLARCLPCDPQGHANVGADLQVTDCPGIFAVGDCAVILDALRPKAGVHAVRQGPVLARNIVAVAQGKATVPHKPQKHHLKIVSLGGKSGLAIWRGAHVAGPWVWRWKDRIDRRFMARTAR